MSVPRVLCVVGPTASGKSEVAEIVACDLGGEIVSVDAMQVYRGMDIGTAKVPADERRVPLHMVDVADVCEPYSVARFQSEARSCVDDILSRGGVPILCGGTGLYLDSIIDELEFPEGEVQDSRRSSYEAQAREQGAEALHALLMQRDPQSAALIHPNNVRRVIRALELCDDGASYARRNEGLRSHIAHYDACIWALVTSRDQLYARINRRVDQMFVAGLVDEVRRLDAQGLRHSQTARQAIGYKEVLHYLDGELDEEQTRELVKRNTRRYAKRQLSWIQRDGRAQPVDLSNKSPQEAAVSICNAWRGLHD